jgi:hypothetical protein
METPNKADPNAGGGAAELANCVAGRSTNSHTVVSADKPVHADSPDFVLADASISSSATGYRSSSDFDSHVAMLRNPKLSTCLRQEFAKQFGTSLPAGAKIELATLNVTPGSGGGPANVVATCTVTIKVSMNGQEAAGYMSIAFMTGPLIEAEVEAFNLGTPIPASAVKALVAHVATRAAEG